jgi:ParB family chromosome partitioning protein
VEGAGVTRPSGLGRGLDALIPRTQEDESSAEAGALRTIDLDDIEPNPRQPRKAFDDKSIAELSASIAELGILQPLLVRAGDGGRLELVAGERRLRAARAAGLKRVPVVMSDTDGRGALERALVENLHREDLNPIEEAAAYRQLMDDGGLTQEALAHRVARGRATIANSLRLLELPVPVQRLIAERKLSGAHGKALLGLSSNPFQERLARRIAHEGLSVRVAEDLVRRYQAMSESGRRRGNVGRPQRPPEATEAQQVLAEHLQTRVRVDIGARKGKVVLDFASTEELDRIVSVILGRTPGGAPHTIRLD